MRHSGSFIRSKLPCLFLGGALSITPVSPVPISPLDPEFEQPSKCVVHGRAQKFERLRARFKAFHELLDSRLEPDFSISKFERDFRPFVHPLQDESLTADHLRRGITFAKLLNANRKTIAPNGHAPARKIITIRLYDSDCSIAWLQIELSSPGDPYFHCGILQEGHLIWETERWSLYEQDWYLPRMTRSQEPGETLCPHK